MIILFMQSFLCEHRELSQTSRLRSIQSRNPIQAEPNDIIMTIEFAGEDNRASQSINLPPDVPLDQSNKFTLSGEIAGKAIDCLKTMSTNSE